MGVFRAFTARFNKIIGHIWVMADVMQRLSPSPSAAKVDAKDRRILALLSQDGRMPAADMAKKVLLSRDAVAYRIRRLQDQGAFLSVVPMIDLERIGFHSYRVFMLLDERARAKHAALVSALRAHPNTKSVMLYTDTWDLEWNMVASSNFEFDRLMTDLLTRFPDVIVEKEQLAVVKRYLSIQVPRFYWGENPPAHERRKDAPWAVARLDKKDVSLLRLLCVDSRKSSYEMGKALGMSPDAVIYRLKRLIESGVIRGFTPLLDYSRLGLSWYTYAVNFRKFDAKDESKFKEFVRLHPHIIYAAKMFGAWDVTMMIVSDSPQGYHESVKALKNEFADIIYNYQTWLAHEELFFTPLPGAIISAFS